MKGKLLALVMVLTALLVGCAAPVATTPAAQSPAPAAPAPAAPAQAAPSPVVTAPAPAPAAPAVTAPAPAASFPMEITDQLGRKVTIKKAPQRIISIAPSDTEILYALGIGPKIIAVDQFSDYPTDTKTKVNLGGYSNPNIEKIISLNPDLIMVTAIHKNNGVLAYLEKYFPVVGLDPKTVDEVLDSLALVGKITGETGKAAEVAASLQSRIKAVTDKTGKLNASQKPRTFYIVWDKPLMSSGNGTFQADLIQKAGGVNVAQGLNGWATISLEQIVTANPEIMIAGSMSNAGINMQFIKTEARLANTDARRQNKVFEVTGDFISRPGPRLVDALEEFARVIHPELFK